MNKASSKAEWRAECLLRKNTTGIHGVVRTANAHWYLVEELPFFRFDGFALIAKSSVIQRRRSRFEKKADEIARLEGSAPQACPLSLEGSNEEIFQCLTELDLLITVEATDGSRYMIGSIHRVTKDRLYLKHFDAAGRWFSRPSGIDFREIGSVRFDDDYGRVWQRYFRRRGKR